MVARLLAAGSVVLIGLLAAAPAALATRTGMSPVVSATLAGKNEVPKGSPSGSGLAVVHLDGAKGTVCWSFAKVSGIGTPTAAHIHKGAPGKAGPVVVPFGGTYKAKGCTKAPGKLVGAIEEHPGSYYVNIHTSKFPAGAIRGKLVVGMHG